MKKAEDFLDPKKKSSRKSISHSKTEVRNKRVATQFILENLEDEGINTKRPTQRGECPVKRPCPFVGCKYHLYLDITDTGSIKYNFYDIEPWELTPTCALDIADDGGDELLSLTDIGEYIGLTRERVRQIEKQAIRKLKELKHD